VKAHLTDLLFLAVNQIADYTDSSMIVIDRPKIISHGDFSTNLCLILSKKLKKSPRDVAAMILDKIPPSDLISKIEIAGPGFLNFFLSNKANNEIINNVLNLKDCYGKNKTGNKQKVQIEFVSANPTGPLHVGHGRGAAIGDCLARLFQASGWSVTREFYYNDTGEQINNLTQSVQASCQNIPTDDPKFPTDGYHGDYINDIAQAFLSMETIECQGQSIKASGKVEDTKSIQDFSVAYLRNEQDQDLIAFRTKFDVYSLESSFYKDGKVESVVNKLIEEGHTYEKDGALWLKTTNFGDDKDRVMKKTDGSYTYFIPDVTYHLDKWERGFKKVINEQGADHHSTISRVRAGLQGLNKNIPEDWPEYVLHQMITVIKGNKEIKISKRAGSYLTLRELINEVGCDATRYFLAARRPDSQLVFDIDLAKSQNNDNPVFYIQYAHARISKVLEQWGGDISTLKLDDSFIFDSQAELKLIKSISIYPEIVLQATNELAPHQIANFLKDCAAELHSYYNDSKFLVKDKKIKIARLSLINSAKYVLRNGLHLLGIEAPQQM
jgi:arginyl-tRNA synthetase